jgi:hypothetical protein
MAGDKSLKESAKSNPTALGDPVSLKAEKSDTSPTEQDRPNKSTRGIESDKPNQNQSAQNPTLQPSGKHNESLKEVAKKNLGQAEKGNRSMIGDPVSLKAETSDRDPVTDGGEREDGTGRSGKVGKGRDSKL